MGSMWAIELMCEGINVVWTLYRIARELLEIMRCIRGASQSQHGRSLGAHALDHLDLRVVTRGITRGITCSGTWRGLRTYFSSAWKWLEWIESLLLITAFIRWFSLVFDATRDIDLNTPDFVDLEWPANAYNAYQLQYCVIILVAAFSMLQHIDMDPRMALLTSTVYVAVPRRAQTTHRNVACSAPPLDSPGAARTRASLADQRPRALYGRVHGPCLSLLIRRPPCVRPGARRVVHGEQ